MRGGKMGLITVRIGVAMQKYDADEAPVAAEWLELDEDDRIYLVKRYHRSRREKFPDLEAHATIHVLAETQLAEGLEAAVGALQRLMAEGLTRHDAIHAIASVNANFIFRAMRGKCDWPAEEAPARLSGELDRLTARKWLSGKI